MKDEYNEEWDENNFAELSDEELELWKDNDLDMDSEDDPLENEIDY